MSGYDYLHLCSDSKIQSKTYLNLGDFLDSRKNKDNRPKWQ